MRLRAINCACLFAAAVVFAGCSPTGLVRSWQRGEYVSRPRNTLADHGIEKVAVVVMNATDSEIDTQEVARIFSVEFQQFDGIKVYPSAVTDAAVRANGYLMPEESHRLGKELGVDAVIVGIITDYEEYEAPRIGLVMSVYPTEDQAAPPKPAVALMTLEKVYDSDLEETADNIGLYSKGRGGNTGRKPLVRRYVVVMSEYLHFVGDRVARDLFALATRVPKNPTPEMTTRKAPELASASEAATPVVRSQPSTDAPKTADLAAPAYTDVQFGQAQPVSMMMDTSPEAATDEFDAASQE